MTPLDLRKAPPRSPREELSGLCMLPRMIDIARAKLPRGDIGQYHIGVGMSALVLRHLDMHVDEFVQRVSDAGNEEALAAQLSARRSAAENRLFNLRLQRATVADVPDDMRERFVGFYGRDLPAGKRIFDLLEEDDARAFGGK
ncbi:MAG: DUF5069 domain-containing protein [Chthoniobacterales bacterium]